MDTFAVTIKGQIVIPSKIRRKHGIKKGTKICFVDKGDEIILKPLTKDYFEKMAGILKSKGKLTQELLQDRARDKEREDKKWQK
ncbi:MAG: AbrB/MazE/SpoVT family DNA-binding domain-containing protein [Elusimicrobia bacterium]|nr:AbrB/MazE/SpoVT family DNA-binding domain-containing protein [Elusimicrobiota bacterium]